MEFTQRQHEIIEGHMLGDGTVFKYEETHKPYFAFCRQATDHKFNVWTHKEFPNIAIKEPSQTEIFDERTQKTYYSSKWRSQRNDILLPYLTRWYPEHDKVVPRDLVLTPLTCAVWFADDGWGGPGSNKGTYAIRVKMSTHGFTYKDNLFLAEKLNKFCEVEDNWRPYQDAGNWYLACSSKGAYSFMRRIKDYVPEAMSRKTDWLSAYPDLSGVRPKKGLSDKKRNVKLTAENYDSLQYMALEYNRTFNATLANLLENSITLPKMLPYTSNEYVKQAQISQNYLQDTELVNQIIHHYGLEKAPPFIVKGKRLGWPITKSLLDTLELADVVVEIEKYVIELFLKNKSLQYISHTLDISQDTVALIIRSKGYIIQAQGKRVSNR